MKRALIIAALAASLWTGSLAAQTAAPVEGPGDPAHLSFRYTLGHARLFSNDELGDHDDRWRSGSYMVSALSGFGWSGTLPEAPGSLLEYRLRSEIIAPSTLQRPPPDDRRYAGILGFGLHSHFQRAGIEMRLGGELVVTGPQTGVGAFQREFHEAFDYPRPRVLGSQIGNGIHPTLSAEFGRSRAFGQHVTLRPFVEAQAGIEDLARIGADLTFGHGFDGALMVRDTVTGHRVQGIAGANGEGFTFVLGGDLAHVFDSTLLPDAGPAPLRDTRSRVRAGVHWRGEKSEFFYGLTWLGREFETQSEDQLVGSLRLRLRF